MMHKNQHIGRAIKAARILADLEQDELADRLGLSRQSVCDTERMIRRRGMRDGTLKQYADALGFTPEEILTLAKMAR